MGIGQRIETSRDLGPTRGLSSFGLFAVDVSSIAGESVLTLHGELDISAQARFASALAGVDNNDARIVIDLSDLTFIDCSNIGLIHDMRVEAGLRGAHLELRCPNPHLLRILELTGLVPRVSSERVQHRVVLPLPSRALQRASM